MQFATPGRSIPMPETGNNLNFNHLLTRGGNNHFNGPHDVDVDAVAVLEKRLASVMSASSRVFYENENKIRELERRIEELSKKDC